MIAENDKSGLQDTIQSYFTNDNRADAPATHSGPILLFGDSPAIIDRCREVIGLTGHRVAGLTRLSGATACLERQLNTAAVVVRVPALDSTAKTALKQIEAHCAQMAIPLVLVVDLARIDEVMALTSYQQVDHIVLDDHAEWNAAIIAEMMVALPQAIQRSQIGALHDREEIDIVDLKKISADVERIARALNQLSDAPAKRPDPELSKGPGFEPHALPTEASGAVMFGALDSMDPTDDGLRAPVATPDGLQPVSAEQVRKLIRARRMRDQYFDAELFADPAWDMLLDLLAARLENVQVSVSSLCIAASVPPTTGLRWIKTMTEENIFLRKADADDGRRIFIELSDAATAGMIGFFSMIRRNQMMMI